MTSVEEYKYLVKIMEERFDSMKRDMNRLEKKVDNVSKWFVTKEELILTLWPIRKSIADLEARNLWIDRIVWGALIMALLWLIISKWWIG